MERMFNNLTSEEIVLVTNALNRVNVDIDVLNKKTGTIEYTADDATENAIKAAIMIEIAATKGTYVGALIVAGAEKALDISVDIVVGTANFVVASGGVVAAKLIDGSGSVVANATCAAAGLYVATKQVSDKVSDACSKDPNCQEVLADYEAAKDSIVNWFSSFSGINVGVFGKSVSK